MSLNYKFYPYDDDFYKTIFEKSIELKLELRNKKKPIPDYLKKKLADNKTNDIKKQYSELNKLIKLKYIVNYLPFDFNYEYTTNILSLINSQFKNAIYYQHRINLLHIHQLFYRLIEDYNNRIFNSKLFSKCEYCFICTGWFNLDYYDKHINNCQTDLAFYFNNTELIDKLYKSAFSIINKKKKKTNIELFEDFNL